MRGQNFIDLTGQKFGRLNVIERSENFGRRTAWLCRCECGNEVRVRAEHLRGGRVNSCGCIRKEAVAMLKFKHGEARKGECSAEFVAWCAAKARCFNVKSPRYPEWGGRGITMHPEWIDSFQAFLGHVGRRPSPKMTLDRIDNNGNYEPGNVRWASKSQQRINQRRMQA